MGKFNDYYQAIKTALGDGFVPYGGTIGPTSAEFSTLIAQFIRGGSFSLPDNDTLRDIPVPIMVKDMMVTVSAHVDGVTETPRRTYFLNEVPSIRLSESGDNILDWWVPLTVDAEGGPDPIPGTNGWSPLYGSEADGSTRVVRKLLAWFGGTGSPPTIDANLRYEGQTGLVAKSNATNYKGNPGPAGPAGPVTGMGMWVYGTASGNTTNLIIAPLSDIVLKTTSDIKPSKECTFLVFGNIKFQQDSGTYDAVMRVYIDVQRDGGSWLNIANAGIRPYLNNENTGQSMAVFTGYLGLAGQNHKFRLRFSLVGGGGSYRDDGYLVVVGLHNTTF